MLNILKFYCILLGLTLFAGVSHAVEVKNLYLVKWPVAEQSKTARWKAALGGFKEVLVRKSGSTAILQSSDVQQAYRKVTSYLQRFEYIRQSTKNSKTPYIISLYFEPRLIDKLIQDAKMPLWGANRPVTIMWIAVEENYKRQVLKENLVKDNQQNANYSSQQLITQDLVDSIQENATRRGIPVILPLMDLDDELIVSISDIWGLFPTTITEASQRYSADSIIFGRIRKQGERWIGNFGYLNQKDEFNFETKSETSQQVIAGMIDKLSELLCNKYCVIEETGQKNEILMNLSDVNNFSEFKASENYLKNLSSIEKTEVIKIDQFQVLYKLTLFGQIGSLIEGIGLSRKIVVDEAIEKKVLEQQVSEKLAQETNKSSLPNVHESTSELLNEDLPGTESNTPVFDVEGNQILKSDSIETNDKMIEDEETDSSRIETIYYRWIG